MVDKRYCFHAIRGLGCGGTKHGYLGYCNNWAGINVFLECATKYIVDQFVKLICDAFDLAQGSHFIVNCGDEQ